MILRDRPRKVGCLPDNLYVNARGYKVYINSEKQLAKFMNWGYKPAALDQINLNAKYPNTVLIHRYRGGLGDIICILPGVLNMMRQIDTDVLLAIPKIYHFLFPEDVRCVNYRDLFGDKGRHTTKYFQVREQYGLAIDLYCPAGMHETYLNQRPIKNRIEIFTEMLEGEPVIPKIKLAPLVNFELTSYLKNVFDTDKIKVGIQIGSERIEKDWSPDKWMRFARKIKKYGFQPITFHSENRLVSVPGVTDLKLEEVAHVIDKHIDVMIGIDSGLMHLAAGLGKPTYWLFGPTDGALTLKYYLNAEFIQYIKDPLCHCPCYYNEKFNNFRCYNQFSDCMGRIKVNELVELFKAFYAKIN